MGRVLEMAGFTGAGGLAAGVIVAGALITGLAVRERGPAAFGAVPRQSNSPPASQEPSLSNQDP
jgi:hypothetical protein